MNRMAAATYDNRAGESPIDINGRELDPFRSFVREQSRIRHEPALAISAA
jgi:hypothetical protein